jgi:hypothetical protein
MCIIRLRISFDAAKQLGLGGVVNRRLLDAHQPSKQPGVGSAQLGSRAARVFSFKVY